MNPPKTDAEYAEVCSPGNTSLPRYLVYLIQTLSKSLTRVTARLLQCEDCSFIQADMRSAHLIEDLYRVSVDKEYKASSGARRYAFAVCAGSTTVRKNATGCWSRNRDPVCGGSKISVSGLTLGRMESYVWRSLLGYLLNWAGAYLPIGWLVRHFLGIHWLSKLWNLSIALNLLDSRVYFARPTRSES